MNNNDEWQQCETKVFWSDVAANEHVVQIYDNDTMLLNTLADYASNGFHAGDAVVIIATGKHITALNTRLKVRGLDLKPLIAANQYIPLDADETLAKFMISGMPDATKFVESMTAVMARARKNGREVRAFGEMVAMLWERGNAKATMELEGLWNKFCATQKLSLFCAYPKNGFGHNADNSVMHICSAHSKVIQSNEKSPLHIYYKETQYKAVI